MKKYKKILIIIAAVLVGLLIFKNSLIKGTVTTVGSSVVGAPLKIKKFSLGLISQKIRIKDIQLYNPKGFPKEVLIDIPEVSVDYNLGALIKGKLHLPLVVLDLKEMVVIKNKEGVLNVDSLKVVKNAKEAKPEEKKEEKKPKKKAEAMPMQIDTLKLNIGRVVYKDYSKGGEPEIQAFELDLKDKTFENIKSPEQLVTLVMFQAMKGTTIQGAGLYAAATVLGAGFLPVGVAGVLIGDDDSSESFSQNVDQVYDVCLGLAKQKGTVKNESKETGIIKAKMDGHDVTISVKKEEDGKTQVIVSARKLLIPKPKFAGGVLYQISQELK